ncbi:MAG: hypothetical protein SYC29_13845 [Planctomycetota bacterium]|nr:hypothetical protein [Planctomycetota bacterium]
MKRIDVARFARSADVLAGTRWYLVVKSQDQLERRARMAASRRRGRFGRIEARPVAEGLLVCGELREGCFNRAWSRAFREPRHLRRLNASELLLTEINRLLRIDELGRVNRDYHHPFFAFLHTIDLHPSGERALIVSSGYDSVIELDLVTGEPTMHWIAWEHGFNPDESGTWLAARRQSYERYRAEGRTALLINPDEYGDQGLITARRSAHPNAAAYDPYDDHRSFIVSIGHTGDLHRAGPDTEGTVLLCSDLRQMPHGLRAYDSGWIITDTTRGEWRRMTSAFRTEAICSTAGLADKAPGTEALEWLQQVVVFDHDRVLALDANRGLIAIDLKAGRYTPYEVDPDWCVQDAMTAPPNDPSSDET